MSNAPFLEQLEQNLNGLIAEKKFKSAYEKCINILKENPEDKRFIKLKKRIEEEVEDSNKKIIKEKLEEIAPLWKDNKYVEILKELQELLKLSPKNTKLLDLYKKAQTAYIKEVKLLQDKFDKEQNKKLGKLLESDESKLLDELFYLEKNNPGNSHILELTKKFRTKLIENKIKEKSDLIYSDKYDSIQNFINQLRKIDKQSEIVDKLEHSTKKRELGTQFEEKTEFVYKGEQHLNNLMRLKKYDKAIKVAEELLSVDQNNKKVSKTLKKAEQKFFAQTKNETIESINKEKDKLKSEYEKDKKSFTKI